MVVAVRGERYEVDFYFTAEKGGGEKFF